MDYETNYEVKRMNDGYSPDGSYSQINYTPDKAYELLGFTIGGDYKTN